MVNFLDILEAPGGGVGVGYVEDDVEVDKETEDSLLKEDDKEAFMETEEYKVW